MADSSQTVGRASVKLTQVSKLYGDHAVRALNAVSLTVDAGDFVAIMGPSGCGKSTLLNLIGAIDRPSSGSIHLGDRDITLMKEGELTALRGASIGFIFQFF